MESKELQEVKREFLKEMDTLKRDYQSFKRRASVIANLFIPGLGFVLFGSEMLKGLISFVLYFGYLTFFFKIINPSTDIGWLYFIPAIIICIVSTAIVSGLSD